MNRQRAHASSWKNRPMPPENKELAVEGILSRDEYGAVSLGYIPQSPADKWFIYLEKDWLYFHRSQTGTCVFQVQIEPFEDRYAIVKAVVNRNPQQYRNTDDAYDVALIAYVIDTVLLGRFAPFPQMKGLSADDQVRHQRHVMGASGPGGGERMTLRVLNGRQH